jgi:hypothetical protein
MQSVDKDEPNEEIIQLLQVLHDTNKYEIIICSSRDDISRRLTEEWLNKYGIKYDQIYFRKKGDRRKDYLIKEEMWRDISTKYNIYLMFDDRNQVVNYARKMGLKVCQVAEGDF